MMTRLALAGIHFYQNHLRRAGWAAMLLAAAVTAAAAAALLFGVPLALLAASRTPAPGGPLLALATLVATAILVLIVGVAGLAIGAPFSSCRYTPSCSNYALIAYGRFGPLWGSLLTVWRLLRCAPWGGHGWDPVPERDDGRPDRPDIPRQVPPDRRHPHGQLLPPEAAR